MIVAMRTDFASVAIESLRWPSSKVRKMAKLFYDRRCINHPHNETVLGAWAYALRLKRCADMSDKDLLAHVDQQAASFYAEYRTEPLTLPTRTADEAKEAAAIHRADYQRYTQQTIFMLRLRLIAEHERYAEGRAWAETPGAAYVERRRKEHRERLHQALRREHERVQQT